MRLRSAPVLLTLAVLSPGTAVAMPSTSEAAPADAEDDEDSGVAAVVAPLLGYDSNLKLGVGAFAQVVWADETEAEPFRALLGAQTYFTTGGMQDHVVYWDLPGLLGTRLRWDARVRYLSWSRAPYFGIGAATARLPAADVSDDYYLWSSERWFLRTNVRRQLGETPWDAYASYVLNLQGVEVYPGSLLEADLPPGVDGEPLSLIGLGGFRDTRTNEIDPSDGSVLDLQVRGSSPLIGAASEWWGVHASARRWWSPHDRIVFAGRALVDSMFGSPPFFQQSSMGGLQRGSYGGRFFLRGLPEERLRVDGIAGLQGEVRWRYAQFTVMRTIDVGLQLVPFVDTAQAWMMEDAVTLDPWITTGAGMRMNIKELLVVRADGGLAWERYATGAPRRPQTQIYILADHPF